MKKFILSIALLGVLTTTLAQYSITIIPIIDKRMEIGFYNTFPFLSFSDEVVNSDYNFTQMHAAEGSMFNPGAYFAYGITRDWNSDVLSTENMLKFAFSKSKYTLKGEDWISYPMTGTEVDSYLPNYENTVTPFNVDYEDYYLSVQYDYFLKFHLMDNDLEAALGIFVAATFNLNSIYNFSVDGGPQVKVAYKIDRVYFAATVGYDLLSGLGISENMFSEYGGSADKYRTFIRRNPVMLGIGVGYLFD